MFVKKDTIALRQTVSDSHTNESYRLSFAFSRFSLHENVWTSPQKCQESGCTVFTVFDISAVGIPLPVAQAYNW
jgi:hypothetical protein